MILVRLGYRVLVLFISSYKKKIVVILLYKRVCCFDYEQVLAIECNATKQATR